MSKDKINTRSRRNFLISILAAKTQRIELSGIVNSVKLNELLTSKLTLSQTS